MQLFTLLYAEDDSEALEDTRFLLADFFNTIHAVQDGEKALSTYEQMRPDILLLDINLPKVDGLSIAKIIRENNKEIPIILVTAHSDQDKLLEAIKVGITSYIIKPFDMHTLHENISKAVFECKESIRKKENFLKLSNLNNEFQKKLALVDSNVIMSTANKDGKIIEVTQAFLDLCGYSADEVIGSTHNILSHNDTSPQTHKSLWLTILQGKVWRGEIKNRKKDGSAYWVMLTVTPVLDEDDNIQGFTSIQVDLTEQKNIEYRAITDSLTNILNRSTFDACFNQSVSIAKRHQTYLSFFMIDIDFFKQYNDTYGHQSGDKVIQKVAQQLTAFTRRNDDGVFRLGGEEFGVISLGLDKTKTLQLATKLKESVEALRIEHTNSNAGKYITISIGVYHSHGNNVLDLNSAYANADSALYKAKREGRNCIVMS